MYNQNSTLLRRDLHTMVQLLTASICMGRTSLCSFGFIALTDLLTTDFICSWILDSTGGFAPEAQ